MHYHSKSNPLLLMFLCLLSAILAYLFSILWRVSAREQALFGRSHLIPMAFNVPQYNGQPTPPSFGTGTYVFDRNGTKVIVYKQLINGFQHAYGSALTAFELGPVGRSIGMHVKSTKVGGNDADDLIVGEILTAIDSNRMISNYLDPRVELLPRREQFGCPGLPPRPSKGSM